MTGVALAAVVREGRVLLTLRSRSAHMGGLWELPGGHVEPGETPAAAALRELQEETGLVGAAPELLLRMPWTYPDRTVEFWTFLVETGPEAPRPLASQGIRWEDPGAMSPREVPPATVLVLEALALRLRRQ